MEQPHAKQVKMSVHFDLGKDDEESLAILHVSTDPSAFEVSLSVQLRHDLSFWNRVKMAFRVLFLPKDVVEWNRIILSDEDVKSMSKVLSIYRYVAKKRKEPHLAAGPVAGSGDSKG